MNWKHRIFMLVTACVVAAVGCESVALMPRPDIDRRDGAISGRRDDAVERNRYGRDQTSDVVGTVQRVDEAAREIHLRTTEGRRVALKYDPRTVVTHRDRELRVEDLRYGDVILVEVARDSRGEQHAEFIRMNDRPS